MRIRASNGLQASDDDVGLQQHAGAAPEGRVIHCLSGIVRKIPQVDVSYVNQGIPLRPANDGCIQNCATYFGKQADNVYLHLRIL